MVVTFYGISKYGIISEYPFGTSIEKITSVNDIIIKRTESLKDKDHNYWFDYKILNKNLEPYIVKRNGWSLGDFRSNKALNPDTLNIVIRDPKNRLLNDYGYYGISDSFWSIYKSYGIGENGIISIFEKLDKYSEYKNWLDYLRTRSDFTLDEQIIQDLFEEEIIRKDDEIFSLNKEMETLEQENEALKAKLKQLEQIFSKANRIFQKQSKKSDK